MTKNIIKISLLISLFTLPLIANAQSVLTEEIKINAIKKVWKKQGDLSANDKCDLKLLEFKEPKKTAKGYSSDYYADSRARFTLRGKMKKNTTDAECDKAIREIKSMNFNNKKKHGTINW